MALDGADAFVDGVGTFSFNGQIVKIDLVTVYPDPADSTKVNPRLAGRLALPLNGAVQLRDGLNRLFVDIQKAQQAQAPAGSAEDMKANQALKSDKKKE